MKFAKVFVAFVIGIVCIAIGLGIYLYRTAQNSLPQTQGTLKVSGLQSPVTVYRDAIGVPHLYAQSLDDLAFAQGFVAAQDRLWQMDIFRRNALGKLSEILGELTLRLDEGHCRMGFREAAARAVDLADPQSRRLLDRYAQGVNAFIRSHADRLPIEFHLLRYKPEPWTPADSLSIALMMAETLNTTWERDLFRGKLLEKYGPQILDDLYPTHSKYEVPVVGADSPARSNASPKTKSQHPQPQSKLGFMPRVSVASSTSVPLSPWVEFSWLFTPEKSFASLLEVIQNLNPPDSDFRAGSNNWVVNGAHSVTGKPLLANDPHLAHSIPSIWYQAHLHALGTNVTGVTFAGTPGVVIGHNEHIAWGMTNLNPDVQDVYVEQFDSDTGTRYRVKGEWKDVQVREEIIKIKGKPDKILRVEVTRHGPVMRREGSKGYALKWTAIEPGGINFPFLKLSSAKNWQEFNDALHDFKGATQNFVYADDQGNIGFCNAGLIPIRRKGTGNVPTPGDTDEYEWTGYIPYDELPHLFNPPEGFIATANQRIPGDSFPYFLANDWEAPYRFARIRKLLKSQEKFSRDDFLRIQADVYSEANRVLAEIVVEASEKVPTAQLSAKAAIEKLRTGIFIASPDNVETTLAEWLRWQLEETVWKGVLGEDLKNYKSGMKALVIENQLVERPARWLPREFKNYDDLLIRSLEKVCRRLEKSYDTKDVGKWAWAAQYPLLFRHPLGRIWPLSYYLNVGPFAQPGTRLTVKQTDSTIGPSMRMVVDFSDFDHSYSNITLGASGQPLSRYYSNQVENWLEVKSFSMHFSDKDVRSNARDVLALEP